MPFDIAVKSHLSPSVFTAKLSTLLLSWIHRHCPSPGFQQLLWAPGSCQKSFSSQSSTGASQWKPKKATPCDGAQPMSGIHYCTLPGGKAHSESMNVSIFNLSDRKRRAKPPLLKQCLHVTHNMCVWFHKCSAQVTKITFTALNSYWDFRKGTDAYTQAHICAHRHPHMCMHLHRRGILSHSHAKNLTLMPMNLGTQL